MKIISTIRAKLTAVYRWAGDEAHRRAVATVIALISANIFGHEIGVDNLDVILMVLFGAGAAAWSSRTNGLAPKEGE